jgi:hypothetical protein
MLTKCTVQEAKSQVKISSIYTYDVKFLALLGAACIYDIIRLRVKVVAAVTMELLCSSRAVALSMFIATYLCSSLILRSLHISTLILVKKLYI